MSHRLLKMCARKDTLSVAVNSYNFFRCIIAAFGPSLQKPNVRLVAFHHEESFNSKLRDELLNTELFYSLKEATVLIERWRQHYNTIRPHSSLGYRPPATETVLPNVDGPTYAVDGLWSAHQLNPPQTLS